MSTELLASVLEVEGFHHYGFARLERPFSLAIYERWLENGFHGEMDYLVRHLPQKAEPTRLLPRALSAIVVTLDYVPHPEPRVQWPLKNGVRVASYAKGRDYHFILKERLERVTTELQKHFPEETFRSFTDSGPVLERDLAARAGLGWIGKNTCLLSRTEGSLFFIAEIYTTLELPVATVDTKDFCGTCTKCLDACPTGALIQPRELDARRCISYLTIESREIAAIDLRAPIGDWAFGCDICQTVCPWNQKVFGRERLRSLEPSNERADLIEDLRYFLSTSNRGLERDFAGSPLARAGGWGLKRNALIVAANRRAVELRSLIETLVDDAKLGELARWTLEQFTLREV